MTDETQMRTTLRSVALIVLGVAVVGAFTAIAVGPVAASHGQGGNYTVVLPNPTDHLPGDQNEENASMQNFASSGDAMADAGAPNGFETLDYLETGSQEIDYSNCGSANTAVFGVDRGNNNSGTKTDDDLLKHMKESRFKEHKIEVEFYSEDDLGGNPTYLNPEDAIVSVQGDGSSGGPCFTMPTEPGWYQTSGMVRGTTEDGETVEVHSKSHYFPICEGCHDEETAREKLGPPPSEDGGDGGDGGDESTPTPTPTSTAEDDSGGDGDGDGDATATPTSSDSTDETTDDTTDETTEDSDGSGDDGGEQTSDDQDTDEQDGGAEQDDTGGNGSAGESDATPTPGGGPGFGPVVAILALLATTLLLQRRD